MNTLIIDKNWETHHDFQRWYYEMLILSNRFKVEYADLAEERVFDRVKVESAKIDAQQNRNARFGGLSFIKINNKLIALDTWCNRKYIVNFRKVGLFNELKPDLYLKMDDVDYGRELGFKSSSWVMFPGGQKFVDFFKWENVNHKYLSMFTSGKHSLRTQHRMPWLEYFRAHPEFWSSRDIRLSEDEYRSILKQCKFGVIIVSNDSYKNTREYEYISCGMPMALNYRPRYEFGFEPDKHYLLLKEPTDLAKLATIDPLPFVEASKYIWENYYRPEAAADYLMQLLK